MSNYVPTKIRLFWDKNYAYCYKTDENKFKTDEGIYWNGGVLFLGIVFLA